MNRKKIIYRWILSALFLITLLPLSAYNQFSGSEIILQEGIIDLREDPQLMKKGPGGITGYYSAEDLRIGSIFISADNVARKVVDIYEEDGKTIIETEKPRMEEVFNRAYIPDQTVQLTRDNIIPESIAEGVTLINAYTPPTRSAMNSTIAWMDTDVNPSTGEPRWHEEDIIATNVNLTLWKGSGEGEMGGDKDNEPDKEKQTVTSQTGGSSTTSGSAGGDVRLVGTLRFANPIFKSGLKMPSMKISWVSVWWGIGYPKITFEKGYIHASVDLAEQFDFKIIGTINLKAERKIPLYGIVIQDKTGSIQLAMGIYIKVSIEGQITIGVEVSEYSRLNLNGTLDLVWPFIPVNIRLGSDKYYNFAYRPFISASALAKAGVYAGLSGTALGMDIITAEIGAGLYLSADGYLEPYDVMGYANGTAYGSFDRWYYDIELAMGAYLEAELGFLSWSTKLLDYKWPFITFSKSGEF